MSVKAGLEVVAKAVSAILIALGFILLLVGYSGSPINESEVSFGVLMVLLGTALYILEILIKKYGKCVLTNLLGSQEKNNNQSEG